MEVTRLSMEGICIPHKLKIHYQEDMKQFLKEGERVNRLQNGFNHVDLLCIWNINHTDLPSVWSIIVKILMRYFTLEGRFCRFYTYLFPMLSHLRYNVKMNFPFLILSSHEQSVRSVQAKCKKLPIHQGLIDHLCNFYFTLLTSLASVCKNTLTIHDPLGKKSMKQGGVGNIRDMLMSQRVHSRVFRGHFVSLLTP